MNTSKRFLFGMSLFLGGILGWGRMDDCKHHCIQRFQRRGQCYHGIAGRSARIRSVAPAVPDWPLHHGLGPAAEEGTE